MSVTRYLFRTPGGMPVVTPPAEIDTTTAGPLRAMLAAQAPAERPLIKPALGGLRFARNWMGRGTGLEDVIQTGSHDAGIRRITQWTWRPVREPAFASFPPRGQAWELARYRAYQAHLAGHTIGETVGRAVTFLTLAGANTASAPAVSADL